MQLVPHILELERCRRPPALLAFHLGENDLLLLSAVELTNLIGKDLQCISQVLPDSRVACMDLLPWRVCHGTVKPK